MTEESDSECSSVSELTWTDNKRSLPGYLSTWNSEDNYLTISAIAAHVVNTVYTQEIHLKAY